MALQHPPACNEALENEGIREHILVFLGAGHWLFAALISKAWKKSYECVPHVELIGINGEEYDRVIVCSSCGTTLRRAAFEGQPRLELACSAGLKLWTQGDRQLQHIAGRFASSELLLLAREAGLPWTESVSRGAAESGCLLKVQFLRNEHNCPVPADICLSAAACGSLGLLVWLIEHGYEIARTCSWQAAYSGHLHIIQYLHEERLLSAADAARGAAKRGRAAILQWMHTQQYTWHAHTTLQSALESGSLDTVTWLQQQRPQQWDAALFRRAALSGSVPLCEYLLREGCPVCERASTTAAQNGHHSVLRLLHKHGAPRNDRDVYLAAVRSGSNETMECALSISCGTDAAALSEALTNMLAAAGASCRLFACEWLLQRGAEWPPVLQSEDGTPWPRAMAQWAQFEGYVPP